MKHVWILFLLCLPLLTVAKTPDEEDILLRTMDNDSPYGYTSLMLRYRLGDNTLNDEDYHYLYYGYAYQDDYKPLESNPALDRVLELTSALQPEQPDRELLEALISAGKDALKKDPFSPKVLNLMAFAYGALDNKEQEEAYANRMNGVIRTILSSGDGFTQNTPRHILMFDHAIDVLAAEGLTCNRGRIISRSVEFLPLTVPYVVEGKKRKGFYFDYSRIYRNKPEGYTYKRDRTWQFNNLKPREYK